MLRKEAEREGEETGRRGGWKQSNSFLLGVAAAGLVIESRGNEAAIVMHKHGVRGERERGVGTHQLTLTCDREGGKEGEEEEEGLTLGGLKL